MRDANRQAIADAAGTWAEAQAALEAADVWQCDRCADRDEGGAW